MILEDWHTHNKLCRHAKGDIEEYVITGIEKGISTLGISDHFPYDVLDGIENIPYQEYSMRSAEIQEYIERFKKCKEKYKEDIDLKLAFEVDFIRNQEDNSQSYLKQQNIKNQLDYILGSVHVLRSEQGIFAFDDRRFIEFYNLFGGIDNLYAEYFKTLRAMLNSKKFDFDIVTHFDLPKKYNQRPKDLKRFNREIGSTLKLIKEKDKTIEINTSGLRKQVHEVYPSDEIIKKINSLEIPVLLGSDAHEPKKVGYNFEEIIIKLKEIGFTEVTHFHKRKRTYIPL
jgi:histidinol-phosphatase (PHP family)